MLHAMIMAGGGGTRFWPRSRAKKPKQFLQLGGEKSLIQQAYERLEATVPPERMWVITAEAYRQETKTHLPLLPDGHVIGEPVGRDTAPCVALGAALIHKSDPDAIMLVSPADHVIEPVQEFRRAVHSAHEICKDNPETFLTFGIPPTYPAVGYGYIQKGPEATPRVLPPSGWGHSRKNHPWNWPNNFFHLDSIFGIVASLSGMQKLF